MVLCSELWVQESGKHQGERKIDLLMHALVSTITLTTFPLDFLILFFVKFLFSFLFSLCVFSLSIYLLSLFLSPPAHNYLYPFYTCLNLWDFSLLSPRLYQPLLVSYGHLSRITY